MKGCSYNPGVLNGDIQVREISFKRGVFYYPFEGPQLFSVSLKAVQVLSLFFQVAVICQRRHQYIPNNIGDSVQRLLEL